MTAIEAPSYNWKGAMTPTDGLTTGGIAGGPLHFIGVGGDGSMLHGCHFSWDATFAGQITIWSSNYPLPDAPLTYVGNGGPWVQQNPAAGYTAISPSGAATTPGGPLVLNIPGGTAGGADMPLSSLAPKRLVARVSVTAAGVLIARAHGKF